MNPVHAGWALTTAGALIFFSLGLLVQSLRRPSGARRPAADPSGDTRRLAEALAAAEARVEGLERTLQDERKVRAEREPEVVAEAGEDHHAAAAAAGEAVARLEGELERERAALAAVSAELDAERARSREATARCESLAAELEAARATAPDQPRIVPPQSTRDAAERSWSTPPATPPAIDAEASPPALDAEASRSEDSDALTWEAQSSTRLQDVSGSLKMRILERRLRSLQEQNVESERHHRPSDPGVNKRALSGAIGDLVLKLASKRGVHSAVLADAQGLPFTGVGLPRYLDGVAAYAGLIGQLTSHAHDFIPMQDVVRCCLFDDHDLAFCCWLFKVGDEGFTLSTLSAEPTPNELVMRRTIADLCLALS
jgi:hypothetical protein